MFFALDGIDGAGKSTHVKLCADWLRSSGHEVIECADPGSTAIGRQVRNLLLDPQVQMSVMCEAVLFMASRAQLVSEIIQPALRTGKHVVSDRFLLANVVYQGHASELDPEILYRIGLFSASQIEPDLTLVIDVPLELAQTRRKKYADRIEGRGAEYYAKVRAGFLSEAKRRPDRVAIVDGSGSVDVVQQRIRDRLLSAVRAFSLGNFE